MPPPPRLPRCIWHKTWLATLFVQRGPHARRLPTSRTHAPRPRTLSQSRAQTVCFDLRTAAAVPDYAKSTINGKTEKQRQQIFTGEWASVVARTSRAGGVARMYSKLWGQSGAMTRCGCNITSDRCKEDEEVQQQQRTCDGDAAHRVTSAYKCQIATPTSASDTKLCVVSDAHIRRSHSSPQCTKSLHAFVDRASTVESRGQCRCGLVK